mgnify:CR=1 FL=1
MEILSTLKETYPLFGWLGCLVIFLASLVTGLVYRGKDNEHYSPFNHYISELGELGVSRLAWLFNTGLVIGGILFVLMMVGLGLMLSSVWGLIASSVGMIAGVFCAMVGIFPMNHMKQHSFVAMTYFRAGLLTVLLYTIAVFVQPADGRVLPLYVNIFSLMAFLSYGLFILLVDRAEKKKNPNDTVLDTSEVARRPNFWIIPFLEWLVFFTTLLWFLAVSLVG